MADVITTIELAGFDPEGEPVLRVMADGSLQLLFELMPPSFVADEEGLGPFHDFDQQLEVAAGVPVVWEDRELFVIPQPRADTIDRVRAFLQGYRSR